MTPIDVTICQSPLCQQGTEHPERELHRQMVLLFGRLDEHQRRWFVALESKRIGHGGDRLMSQITGMDKKTIRRGREELAASLADQPPDRIRRAGGGRPPVEKRPCDSPGTAGCGGT